MKKKVSKKKEKEMREFTDALIRSMQVPSVFDPMGSYTGTNVFNDYAPPVQDTDDL